MNSETPANNNPISRPEPNQPNWKDLDLPCVRTVPQHSQPTPNMIQTLPSHNDAYNHMVQTVLGGNQTLTIATNVCQVTLIDTLMNHIVEKRPDARERYAEFVIPALTNPFEIWETKYDDGTSRYAFIGLFDTNYHVVVIVHISENGNLFWNLITKSKTKDLNKQRKGILLHKCY